MSRSPPSSFLHCTDQGVRICRKPYNSGTHESESSDHHASGGEHSGAGGDGATASPRLLCARQHVSLSESGSTAPTKKSPNTPLPMHCNFTMDPYFSTPTRLPVPPLTFCSKASSPHIPTSTLILPSRTPPQYLGAFSLLHVRRSLNPTHAVFVLSSLPLPGIDIALTVPLVSFTFRVVHTIHHRATTFFLCHQWRPY